MGTKRKRATPPGSPAVFNNKMKTSVEARVDPTYGQRNALPGLDPDTRDQADEDSQISYDDDGNMGDDALSYLRSVRQEASAIPNLLVASNTSSGPVDSRANEKGRYEVHYQEGAFYSTSIKPAIHENGLINTTDLDDTSEIDLQEAYYASFLARYETLRTALSTTPPASVISTLSDDSPTDVPRLTTPICRKWRYRFGTQDPLPVQLACMDKQTVLRLLTLMVTGNLVKKGKEINMVTSRWIWGLLARLPDRGELTSEEIGVVRELGKRAVLVAWGLREGPNAENGLEHVEEDVEDEVEANEEAEDGEIENSPSMNCHDEDECESAGIIRPRLPSLGDHDDEQPGVKTESASNHAHADISMESSIMSDSVSALDVQTEQDKSNPDIPDNIAAVKARLLARLQAQSQAQVSTSSNQTADDPYAGADSGIEGKSGNSKYRVGLKGSANYGMSEEIDTTKSNTQKEEELLKYNTRATIDMIPTIVGEVYGQRDLLEFRRLWST